MFLTSQVLLATADKELMEWRDKRVLVIDREKIQAIEVVNSANTIRIIQQDEEWHLESPIQERADQNAVSGLLSTVEFGEAQEFVSDEPEELRAYGLDSPTATIRVQHEDQGGWRTLELGWQEGEYFLARNLEGASVFTVSQEIRDKLNQDVLVFRDKDVVDVEQNEIARIVIQRKAEEEIALRYEDYKWIVESPEGQKDQEALAYNFWYPINEILFASIRDESSDLLNFPEPDVKLSVTLNAGRQRTFVFAEQGDRYLALKVESGRQGTISQEDFEKTALQGRRHFLANDADSRCWPADLSGLCPRRWIALAGRTNGKNSERGLEDLQRNSCFTTVVPSHLYLFNHSGTALLLGEQFWHPTS